jgi:hypothetical protein
LRPAGKRCALCRFEQLDAKTARVATDRDAMNIPGLADGAGPECLIAPLEREGSHCSAITPGDMDLAACDIGGDQIARKAINRPLIDAARGEPSRGFIEDVQHVVEVGGRSRSNLHEADRGCDRRGGITNHLQ